jgi:Ser/Thr protein kinase RdoA (MazF antagonist)
VALAEGRGLDHALVADLVRRRLVEVGDVLSGDLVLRDLSRRNANILVERRHAPSHFLKWATASGGRDALEREAGCYRAFADAGVRDLAPLMREYDPEAGLLVLEGLPGARSLRAFHTDAGRLPVDLGALVGDTLAALHGLEWRPRSRAETPWVLEIHRPTAEAFRDLTSDSRELIRIVQAEPGIGAVLDALREGWESGGLVHNDLKWDNVLVMPGLGGLRIVDWEHVIDGDPLWDVGCAIAGYLGFWILSMGAGGGSPANLAGRSGLPLDTVVPPIATLWEHYLERRGLGDESQEMIARVVRMAGARLLTTAYEATQGGSEINGHVVLYLQLAANLLERPREALGLLGLDAPAPAPSPG